jgi:type IV pilus assembly protein PilC
MALNSKITSAFSYPAFLFALMIVLFVVMTTVVLPKFSAMYETFDAELPGITLAVMAISDFLLNYGLIVLAGILLVAGIFYLLLRYNKNFARYTSRTALRIPVFGRLALVSNTCNFSQISCALLMAGVEVVESVRIASTVVKNNFLRGAILSSLDGVSQGSTLHTAFHKLLRQILDKISKGYRASGVGGKRKNSFILFTKLEQSFRYCFSCCFHSHSTPSTLSALYASRSCSSLGT